LSDFSEILYDEAERHVDKGCWTKNAFFLKSKITDGHEFGKSLNRHISVKNLSPILMKFGTQHQIFNHISVKNCPISMKFGMLQQMFNPIAVT